MQEKELTMRKFEHPNMDGFVCPICHTSADEPVILVPIPGTERDTIVECQQVHAECYQIYAKMHGVEVTFEN